MRDALAAELFALESAGVRRRLRSQDDLGPTTARFDGREAVVFAGNDYLGLSRHPDVVREASLAAERYGTSATASRLVSGNHPLYAALEDALSAFKGTERALVFSTGYMANVGLLTAILGADDAVYIDKLDHASIYDAIAMSGARMRRYPHGEVDRLAKMLHVDPPARRRFIVTDGVFSMDGDIAPLVELRAVADSVGCALVVDDAHGTGVVGPGGKGSSAACGCKADVEVGTLSKALGSVGGFVACSEPVADYLVNKARPFVYSTGLPPASIAAATRALGVLAAEPWRQERVLGLATRVRRDLSAAGFAVPNGVTPIVPVIVGDEREAVALADACLAEGVFVPAIRTPSVPKGSARLRMTLSAAHSDDEVSTALAVLTTAGKELGIVG